MSILSEIKEAVDEDKEPVDDIVNKILNRMCCKEQKVIDCPVHFKNETTIAQMKEELSNGDKVFYSKIFAEFCKNEFLREYLLNEDIIKIIISNLIYQDFDLMEQTCRALGNVCYENENAQKLVISENGTKILMDCIINLPDYDGNGKLYSLYVASVGAFLNTSIDSDDLVLNSGLLEKFTKIISKELEFKQATKLSHFILLILTSVAETRFQDIFSTSFSKTFVDIIKYCEEQEILLDALSCISVELDDAEIIKINLITCGLLQALLQLTEKFTQNSEILETSQSIVLWLLATDTTVEIAYENGSVFLSETLKSWLENKLLRKTAAAILSHMSQNTKIADILINSDFHNKLLASVDDENEEEMVAVLTALGSLANSKEMEILIKDGVLEKALKISKNRKSDSNYQSCVHILFLLRKFCRGHSNNAERLGLDLEFLKILINWIRNDDKLVASESLRLFYAILSNSKENGRVAENILNSGYFKVVAKFENFHFINMQNDVLLTMILSIYLLKDRLEFSSDLIESNFLGALKSWIHKRVAEDYFIFLWKNLVKLLTAFSGLEAISEKMKNDGFLKDLEIDLQTRSDFQSSFQQDFENVVHSFKL